MTLDASPVPGDPTLEVLMHVRLQLTVRLGTCRLSVAEVLKLGHGSIVELDRAAGDPVDLLANDELVARGEIVAVDANYGVRVTELVARPDRP
ncbi:MAG TPA: flagellar motor switch protein FliN [Candidatus Tumulicola sp.]|jgi:flagellar motor switch protein FliN/FliY